MSAEPPLAVRDATAADVPALLALMRGLDAHGAFCKLELVHTCFVARGERQSSSVVETLALRGVFAEEQRALALALAYPSGR